MKQEAPGDVPPLPHGTGPAMLDFSKAKDSRQRAARLAVQP